jgi:hypothetical protein
LADVHVFVVGSVEERRDDIKLTLFEVAGGRNGEEESEICHANDPGENLLIV